MANPALLLTLEYPPDQGGVARYYKNLAEHFRAEELLVRRRGLLWRYFWPQWLPTLWRLPRWVKQGGVSVVLVGQVLPLGYSAWLWQKIKKTPYLIFTHGLDILLPQSRRWKRFWLLKILSGAKAVVANSQFTALELKKLGLSEKKIEIIYPTVDSEFFRPTREEERRGCPAFPYILSVGRLVRRKGFDRVIEVLPRLIKFSPDVRYVLAGRGPDREYLRKKAVANGVAERVIFLEDADDTALRHLYQQCRVLALPCRRLGVCRRLPYSAAIEKFWLQIVQFASTYFSQIRFSALHNFRSKFFNFATKEQSATDPVGPDVEGLGTVILEAAACGKPVVVGKSGGAPEAVKHGYSGFLVDPDSPDELAQALIKILTDQDFARHLGEYGRQMVLEKFVIAREVEKLKKLLSKG